MHKDDWDIANTITKEIEVKLNNRIRKRIRAIVDDEVATTLLYTRELLKDSVSQKDVKAVLDDRHMSLSKKSVKEWLSNGYN